MIMFMLTLLFLALVQLCGGFADWMTKDFCGRPLVEGEVIMNAEVTLSDSRTVKVFRDSVELSSGASYVPGESLDVTLSDIKPQFVFETSAGAFEQGGCEGLRIANRKVAKLTLPVGVTAFEDVVIRAGWATGHSTVFLSYNFTLTPVKRLSTLSATLVPGRLKQQLELQANHTTHAITSTLPNISHKIQEALNNRRGEVLKGIELGSTNAKLDSPAKTPDKSPASRKFASLSKQSSNSLKSPSEIPTVKKGGLSGIAKRADLGFLSERIGHENSPIDAKDNLEEGSSEESEEDEEHEREENEAKEAVTKRKKATRLRRRSDNNAQFAGVNVRTSKKKAIGANMKNRKPAAEKMFEEGGEEEDFEEGEENEEEYLEDRVAALKRAQVKRREQRQKSKRPFTWRGFILRILTVLGGIFVAGIFCAGLLSAWHLRFSVWRGIKRRLGYDVVEE